MNEADREHEQDERKEANAHQIYSDIQAVAREYRELTAEAVGALRAVANIHGRRYEGAVIVYKGIRKELERKGWYDK